MVTRWAMRGQGMHGQDLRGHPPLLAVPAPMLPSCRPYAHPSLAPFSPPYPHRLTLPLTLPPSPPLPQFYFLKSRYEIQIKEIKRSSQYQARSRGQPSPRPLTPTPTLTLTPTPTPTLTLTLSLSLSLTPNPNPQP